MRFLMLIVRLIAFIAIVVGMFYLVTFTFLNNGKIEIMYFPDKPTVEVSKFLLIFGCFLAGACVTGIYYLADKAKSLTQILRLKLELADLRNELRKIRSYGLTTQTQATQAVSSPVNVGVSATAMHDASYEADVLADALGKSKVDLTAPLSEKQAKGIKLKGRPLEIDIEKIKQ